MFLKSWQIIQADYCSSTAIPGKQRFQAYYRRFTATLLANSYSKPITAVLQLFHANIYSMLIVAVSQAIPGKQLFHDDYCSFAGNSRQTPALDRLLQCYSYFR